MSLFRSTDTRTSGGSSDTEATELAVIPIGRPGRAWSGRSRPSRSGRAAGGTVRDRRRTYRSPQELGQDARFKDSTRRDDIPGRAHQKIREVWPARQAAYDAVGERGPAHAHADEPLEHPLAGEFATARAAVGRQHRGGERALVLTGGEDGDEAFGGQLRAPQRSIDPLARERVEEVSRIAHEK